MELLKGLFILFFLILLFIAPVRILGPEGKKQIRDAIRGKTPHIFGALFFVVFGIVSIPLAVNEFSQGDYSSGVAYIGVVVLSCIIWITRERSSDKSKSQEASEE